MELVRIDNIAYKTCVGNFVSPIVRSYLDLFLAYEKGIMPFEGALADQPAKIIELFNIVQYFREQKQKKDNKSEQDKRIEKKLLAKRAMDGK